MRPGRALITAMRSPSRIASSIEWVMNTMVLRSSGRSMSCEQFLLQDFAGLRVERGERLVHQQDRRVHRERAHQPDALLHAAGELIGIVPLESGQADQFEIVRDARA